MKKSYQYDPEDIESLLMHKQFNELYPEEKEFVLRHVEGEDEYESLRSTLFMMHDLASNDEWIEPDASLKKELMREFAREEKKGFVIWLNSLFAFTQEGPLWRQRTAMRYALGGALVLAGIGFFVVRSQRQREIAAVPAKEVTITLAPDSSAQITEPEYADNLKHNEYPPAPVEVGSMAEKSDMNLYNYATDDVSSVEIPVTDTLSNFADATEAIAPRLESEEEDVQDEKKFIGQTTPSSNDVVIEESVAALSKQSVRKDSNVSKSRTRSSALFDQGAQLLSVNTSGMKDVLEVLYTAK